jgi:hypothetical protein
MPKFGSSLISLSNHQKEKSDNKKTCCFLKFRQYKMKSSQNITCDIIYGLGSYLKVSTYQIAGNPGFFKFRKNVFETSVKTIHDFEWKFFDSSRKIHYETEFDVTKYINVCV